MALFCDYCDIDDKAGAPLFAVWMVGDCVRLGVYDALARSVLRGSPS